MSNQTGQDGTKRRSLRVALAILTILLVIALTIVLFIYRDTVAGWGAYGYTGLFLVCLASNATIFLPVPGVLIVFALGAALNPVLVGIIGAAGGIIGELSGYLFGRSGGTLVQNNRIYVRTESLIRRWGVLTIFMFAFLPVTPMDVAGIVAGAVRLPVWQFLLAGWLGKSLKYIALAIAGYYGYEAVLRYLGWPS